MNKLTAEQQEFLNNLTTQMSKQDNRATQYPLFYVYEKEERWVNDDADYDKVQWFSDDQVSIVDIYTDKDENEWKWSEEKNIWRCEELKKEYDEYDFDDRFATGFRKVYIKEVDLPVINVGPFFTEEAAEAHIRANHYHYNKPFTYVNGAWRNPEIKKILEIFFFLSDKETPTCYL